ncbi:PTS glucose transporter subunit IIA [Clostridioides sp. ES-S-0145-01]|uniref:PTS sugar transporter subunit IIA n=1 Tax=Clostridioides sp. ES-S-0145-01 TaxID=2770784 RepID=UPI001D100FBC|nr:PTS glucose transporter subunit IIA [Clostridioides sp. ES-S-0145-01]
MFKKLFSKNKNEEVKSNYIKGILQSPLTGKVLSITDVPDDAFSSKMLGDGIAIEPQEGVVSSPVDGEVIQVFLPAKHAICIKSEDGLEILIHIGLDTVKMNGDGFEVLVNAGDKVYCGQKLIRFNLEKIKKSVKSVITPIVITNSYDIDRVEILRTGDICIGEDLMKVYK